MCMTVNIKQYLKDRLIEPLKNFNTDIQEAILEVIAQRLQEIYDTAEEFPTLIDPNQAREHMLGVLAESFAYELHPNMSIEDQRRVLSHIVEIYKRRGTVDSIENMWKYYGGNLPKNVKVLLPAYNLFRYSISKLSGVDKFKDGKYWRSGVYEIITEDDIDPEIYKDFVMRELTPAGMQVFFSKRNSLEIDPDTSYSNIIRVADQDILIVIRMPMVTHLQGQVLSVNTISKPLSGAQNLFVDLSYIFEDIAVMTRREEESQFRHDLKNIVRYIYPDRNVPINTLSKYPYSGYRVKVVIEPTADPSLFGLDSAVGGHRSYDYLESANIRFWNIRMPQVSRIGALSGRNSLSGAPVDHPLDKSGRALLRLPIYVSDLWEFATIRDEPKVTENVISKLIPTGSHTMISTLRAEIYPEDTSPVVIGTEVLGFDRFDRPKEINPFKGLFLLRESLLDITYPLLSRDHQLGIVDSIHTVLDFLPMRIQALSLVEQKFVPVDSEFGYSQEIQLDSSYEFKAILSRRVFDNQDKPISPSLYRGFILAEDKLGHYNPDSEDLREFDFELSRVDQSGMTLEENGNIIKEMFAVISGGQIVNDYTLNLELFVKGALTYSVL